jgi:hypothetical protein
MMTMIISGSDGVTFPDSTNQFSGGAFSFKNRIINGDMRIDQRNAGAAITINSASNTYSVDRFFGRGDTSDGVFTLDQTTTVPAGFTNSVLATVTTADASIGATQRYQIGHRIEGFNVADLGWGTASAKTVTLSFWVRSSLTGTFGGALTNAAGDRSYPYTYTISSADTWEQKSVTIAGDTSGTWETGTAIGIQLFFSLGAGSTLLGTAGSWAATLYTGATGQTQVIGTLNATWYVTGVQLEVGSVATPFERRPYGAELALCQRYFEKSYDISVAVGTVTGVGAISTVAYAASITRPFLGIQFQVSKRTSATVTSYTPNTANTSGKIGGPSATNFDATIISAGTQAFQIYQSQTTSTSNGDYYIHWTASAEL